MRDAAAAAGVWQATVSLVLNSDSGHGSRRRLASGSRKSWPALAYPSNAQAKTDREGVAGMIGFIGDTFGTIPFVGGIIEARSSGHGRRAPSADRAYPR
jgi:LacI family transcriptional regulator